MLKSYSQLDDAILQTLIDQAAHECVTSDLDAWVAELEKLPDPEISPAFERRMKKLIHGESFALRKIIITGLLVLCGLLGGALCVEASRLQIFRFFTNPGGHTDIFVMEDKAEMIMSLYVPTYIPEGYTLSEVIPIIEGFVTNMKYTAADGGEILFEQFLGKVSIAVDTDHREQTETEVRGEQALLFLDPTGETDNILIWLERGTTFKLNSLLSGEELLKMAESMSLQR